MANNKFKFRSEFDRKQALKTNSVKHVVQTAFEFTSIGEIDTLNEKFQAEVTIESRWKIDALAEPDILNKGEYDPKKNWNPKLFIENALAVKEQITYEITVEDKECYVTEVRHVSGLFWVKMILNNFPVDVQELSIVVSSKIGSDRFELIGDSNKLSFINFEALQLFKDQQKWTLYRFVKLSDKAVYELGEEKEKTDNIVMIKEARKYFKPPKLVAKLYSARKPGFYLMNAFFLVFLITTITFACWGINYFSPHFRLQSTFTILLASVTFKWVVNRSLPAVAYLTSMDAYQITCITFICLLAVWHGIVGAPYTLAPNTALWADRWILLSFGIIYIIIHLLFAYWLFRAYNKVRVAQKEEKKYFDDHRDHFLPCKETYNTSKARFSIFHKV